MSRRGKVLIIGDDTRSFLASVRSLGRKGIEVHAAPTDFTSAALSSRYLSRVHELPYYVDDGEKWLTAMLRLVAAERFDMIMPCNELGLLPLYHYRDRFASTALAIPGDAAMRVLFDKHETRKLAQTLGIPIARGRRVGVADTAESIMTDVGLPVFLKPRRSYSLDTLRSRGEVALLNSPAELANGLAGCGDATHIVEAPFPGQGVGVSILADRGVVKLAFQHRRLREGISGGFYRVSEKPLPHLLEACARVAEAVSHTGVAMFEFREDHTSGAWALLEINARPWGSMALPVALGVDFPYQWYKLLMTGGEVQPATYRAGRFGRNLVPDAEMILGEARAARGDPTALASLGAKIAREVGRLIAGFESQDALVSDDPSPGIVELGQVARRVARKLAKSLRLRRGHEIVPTLNQARVGREANRAFTTGPMPVSDGSRTASR